MATVPRPPDEPPDPDRSQSSKDHRLPGPKQIPSGGMALGGFKEVFRIRDFRLLFWGQAISALGDWVGTLAFIAAAQSIAPGKPAAVVGVLILRLVPSFFATPIGGVLSDRWDRKRIMIWSDVIRFGVILFDAVHPSTLGAVRLRLPARVLLARVPSGARRELAEHRRTRPPRAGERTRDGIVVRGDPAVRAGVRSARGRGGALSGRAHLFLRAQVRVRVRLRRVHVPGVGRVHRPAAPGPDAPRGRTRSSPSGPACATARGTSAARHCT